MSARSFFYHWLALLYGAPGMLFVVRGDFGIGLFGVALGSFVLLAGGYWKTAKEKPDDRRKPGPPNRTS